MKTPRVVLFLKPSCFCSGFLQFLPATGQVLGPLYLLCVQTTTLELGLCLPLVNASWFMSESEVRWLCVLPSLTRWWSRVDAPSLAQADIFPSTIKLDINYIIAQFFFLRSSFQEDIKASCSKEFHKVHANFALYTYFFFQWLIVMWTHYVSTWIQTTVYTLTYTFRFSTKILVISLPKGCMNLLVSGQRVHPLHLLYDPWREYERKRKERWSSPRWK